MRVDELKAAIERRGFLVRLWLPEEEQVRMLVVMGSRSYPCEMSMQDVNYLKVNTPGLIEDYLGLREVTDRQHIVWCKTCHFPLLQDVAGSGQGEGATHWYVYRSAKAGPTSPELRVCPGCQRKLKDEDVGEIEDL